MEFENPTFQSEEKYTEEAVEAKPDMGDFAEALINLTHWRSIATSRRQQSKEERNKLYTKNSNSSLLQQEEPTAAAAAAAAAAATSSSKNLRGSALANWQRQREVNRTLLDYFVSVSTPGSAQYSDNLDGQFIQSLLQRGASLAAKDKFGQTVLHEVAKNWNTSVMELMIRCGGDPNAADFLGRTPLHVAAASNFPEMCRLLLRRGAKPEARTVGGQTPLFFAAKTDSAKSLAALIRAGCLFDSVFDFRGRTPLYVAAELDRSETALALLEHGADAFVQDNTGQLAFVPMVEKMPGLAKNALKQLHSTYRAERKQHFNLFRLHPLLADEEENGKLVSKPENLEVDYLSALKVITSQLRLNLIQCPVIHQFLKVQWHCFGLNRAFAQVALQLLTIILWTLFAIIKEWTQRFRYDLPSEIYRIVILILAMALTAYNIGEEIYEYYQERHRHLRWQQWKLSLLEQDKQQCHPSWPGELAYLNDECEAVRDTTVSYFNDSWNYLDWVCYAVLLASLVSHFIDVAYPGGEGNLIVARWHVRIMAVNIVLLWLRLLKYVKPFEFFGPFIVMLGMILTDLIKFFFLYLEFFIPFACVFWTILGGPSNLKEVDVLEAGTLANYTRFNLTRVTVENLDTVENMLFTLFRLTLVDEYDYDHMVEIDQITAQILLGAWFALSSILLLNLFIAQLSETFKAVYDNAKATASMQKAITLNGYYDNMMQRSKIHFHRHLKRSCNPLKLPYDDDATAADAGDELQKATLQIRSDITELKEKFERLHADELRDSDSDLPDLTESDTAANGTIDASKHHSRSRDSFCQSGRCVKALAETSARIGRMEQLLDSELSSVKQMLRDIAIVVAGRAKPPKPGDASVGRSDDRPRKSRKRQNAAAALDAEIIETDLD